MGVLKNLIDTLLAHPELSNQQIADRVGCDRRRVRRYRNLIRIGGVTAADVAGCDGDTLSRAFNPREPRYEHDEPDFGGLMADHPSSSARAVWELYGEELARTGKHGMSYAQFLRRKQRWEGRP